MKRVHRIITIPFGVFSTIAMLLVLMLLILPWKSWLEKEVQAKLEGTGLQKVRLTVDSLNFKRLKLKNITIGSETPFILKTLSLGYNVSDLWHNTIHELQLSGLTFEIRAANNTWEVEGLDGMHSQSDPSIPFTIPVTRAQVSALPLNRLNVQNSELKISDTLWQLQAPMEFTWQKEPFSTAVVQSTGLQFKLNPFTFVTGGMKLEGAGKHSPLPEQWQGNWSIKSIAMQGKDNPVPALDAAGTLTLLQNTIVAQGTLQNADKTYHATFALNYYLNASQASNFTLKDAQVPWDGGIFSVRNVNVAISNKAPIHINLEVKDVAIAPLMKTLTSDRAVATGTLSGMVPMTITPDGDISFQQGTLQTTLPGTITLSPDTIPGDNVQVALLRDILKNLHYTQLTLKLDSGADHKLSALLSLEGNNPDVYGGKAVKLNVHLSGDVLNLIQQNRRLLNDPASLLKK